MPYWTTYKDGVGTFLHATPPAGYVPVLDVETGERYGYLKATIHDSGQPVAFALPSVFDYKVATAVDARVLVLTAQRCCTADGYYFLAFPVHKSRLPLVETLPGFIRARRPRKPERV